MLLIYIICFEKILNILYILIFYHECGEWIIIPDKSSDTQVEHIYREKTDKRILKKNPWRDYRLHFTVLVLVIIAEMIGTIEIPLTKDVSITIMPLIYTIILGLVFYLAIPIKWIQRKQARIAEGAMMLFIGVLIAKLAVSSNPIGSSYSIIAWI